MADSFKHIFLTGNVQVGKSTILKYVLDNNPDLKIGGLFTRWINKTDAAKAGLYMFPADRKTINTVWGTCASGSSEPDAALLGKLLSSANLIATFDSGNYKKKILFKNVFDDLGKQYLKKAKNADLILIDEIGILEDKSYAFQEEVLKLLNGTVPIIGVVRNKPGTLTDAIKNHPRVDVIEVTRANRDKMKEELTTYIQMHLKK